MEAFSHDTANRRSVSVLMVAAAYRRMKSRRLATTCSIKNSLDSQRFRSDASG